MRRGLGVGRTSAMSTTVYGGSQWCAEFPLGNPPGRDAAALRFLFVFCCCFFPCERQITVICKSLRRSMGFRSLARKPSVFFLVRMRGVKGAGEGRNLVRSRWCAGEAQCDPIGSLEDLDESHLASVAHLSLPSSCCMWRLFSQRLLWRCVP